MQRQKRRILFVRSLAPKHVTYIDAIISDEVACRPSLYDNSHFMNMEKKSNRREREEMMILMTTKYSGLLLSLQRTSPGRGARGARGALIAKKVISKEWSLVGQGADIGFSEVIVVTTAIPFG